MLSADGVTPASYQLCQDLGVLVFWYYWSVGWEPGKESQGSVQFVKENDLFFVRIELGICQ